MIELILLAAFGIAGLASGSVAAADAGESLRKKREHEFARRYTASHAEDPTPLGDPYRTAAIEEEAILVTPAMQEAFIRARLAAELGYDRKGRSRLHSRGQHEEFVALHLGRFKRPGAIEKIQARLGPTMNEEIAAEIERTGGDRTAAMLRMHLRHREK